MQLVRSILERALLLTSQRLMKDLLALLFLAGVVLVFLWPSLFLDKTLLPVDILLHCNPPPLPYALKQTLILLFSLSFGVLFLFLWRVVGFRLFTVVALATTAIDLVGQNLWYYPALDYGLAYFPTASTKFLQEHLGFYRIARYGTEFLESPLAPNTGMVYSLFDVQGSDIYILEDYVAFLNLIEDHRLEAAWAKIPNIEEEGSLDSPLIDLLGVKYILTTSKIGMDQYELAFDGRGKDIKIYENKEVLPRAFVVHRVEVTIKDEEALARLKSDAFDPGQVVIIGQGLPASEVAVNEEAPLRDNSVAQIISYGLNAVAIEAQAENPGFLVFTDLYYPGWRSSLTAKRARSTGLITSSARSTWRKGNTRLGSFSTPYPSK